MKTRIIAVSAILAAAQFVGTPGAQAACDPATRGLQYLAADQLSDGSLDVSAAGFGNPTATEDFAIGAAANGYDPNTLLKGGKTPYDYLAANGTTATSSVGRAAKLVLALAAGNSPAGRFDFDNFGGVHPLTVINSAYHAGTGAYGDGAANGQALAILALKAAGQGPPSASLTWLESIRNTGRTSGGYAGELSSDTGWSYGTGPDQYQGDTNTTAAALQALNAAADATQNGPGLAFLHNQQNPDGGFPLEKPSTFGTASDADSDALVLEALKSTGQPLSGWTIAGNTPLSNLLSMQDAPSGGFSSPAPDTVTSSQVPQGLAQVANPVAAAVAGRALPASGCPAPPATQQQAVAVASPVPDVPSLPRAGAGFQVPVAAWPWALGLFASIGLVGLMVAIRSKSRRT